MLGKRPELTGTWQNNERNMSRRMSGIAGKLSQAHVLGKILSSQTAALSHERFPIALKTPCFPIIVQPPLPANEGEWDSEGEFPHICARYKDSSGNILGYALSGNRRTQSIILSDQKSMEC